MKDHPTLSDPYAKDLPPHVMSTVEITSRTWMGVMLLEAVTAEAERRGVDLSDLFLKHLPYQEGEDHRTPKHTVEVRINGVCVDVPTFFQILEKNHEYFIREAARDLFKARLEETFKPFEQVGRLAEAAKRLVEDGLVAAFPDVPDIFHGDDD